MKRVLLVLWLVLFAVQASEVLAAVAPDQCVEDAGRSSDPVSYTHLTLPTKA